MWRNVAQSQTRAECVAGADHGAGVAQLDRNTDTWTSFKSTQPIVFLALSGESLVMVDVRGSQAT